MGEHLGTVLGREDIGFVGQQHEIDVGAVDLRDVDARIALGPVVEGVMPTRAVSRGHW